MEAILLAGGLGTRLHEVTGDKYPKCLAIVNHKPFLHYIIDYFQSQGVTRFIFALSHHAQMVIDDVKQSYPELDVAFSIEQEPLGTGGAIKQALSHCQEKFALVANADSFIECDLHQFIEFANNKHSELSIICTKVNDISRFGAANIDEHNQLIGFYEKGKPGEGYINAGIYWLNTHHPALLDKPIKFSFENDILASIEVKKFAFKTEGLFFDIGTPDDFTGSQQLVALNKELFG